MRFRFAPGEGADATGPTPGVSALPASTPSKRLFAPSFDDDSSSSSSSAPSSPTPARTRPSAVRAPRAASERFAEALFRANVDTTPTSPPAPPDTRDHPWRGVRAPVARPVYLAPVRAPVVPRAVLPRPALGEGVVSGGIGEMRSRGWRGCVAGGGRAVVAPDGLKVKEKDWGRSVGVGALRVHASVWAVNRGPVGLREAVAKEGGAVADAIITGVRNAVGNEGAGHAGVVFGLVDALYRRGSREENLLHRVVTWATGEAISLVDNFIGAPSRGLGEALRMLSGGDVEGAVEATLSHGYLRLGMLIARALESDKEELRADAAAQLAAYGGEDRFLGVKGGVCHEERMILGLLAGEVEEVAGRLGVSWYRVFAMQLLFGAGSREELMHEERVSAAVCALAADPHVFSGPPHAVGPHSDAAYHLLRMYADPTASYSLTAGVYSSGSFGNEYDPMNAHLPWLLHQVLSALVPRAELRNAVRLSDAYAAQLAAAGMPLWSFYVLCSGSPPAAVVKEALLRLWPAMAVDRVELPESVLGEGGVAGLGAGLEAMCIDEDDVEQEMDDSAGGALGPYAFLVGLMRVPPAWIHEARALLCRVEGDEESECEQWLLSKTSEGLARAQELISKVLFPRAVGRYDAQALERILGWLKVIENTTRLPNWSTSGGLILDYLKHAAPETMARPANTLPETYASLMTVYRSMAQRIGTFESQARTPVQQNAAVTIADGILCAERIAVMFNTELMNDAMDDLDRIPASPACKQRVCGEYVLQTGGAGVSGAYLYASALPVYTPYIGRPRVPGVAARVPV